MELRAEGPKGEEMVALLKETRHEQMKDLRWGLVLHTDYTPSVLFCGRFSSMSDGKAFAEWLAPEAVRWHDQEFDFEIAIEENQEASAGGREAESTRAVHEDRG